MTDIQILSVMMHLHLIRYSFIPDGLYVKRLTVYTGRKVDNITLEASTTSFLGVSSELGNYSTYFCSLRKVTNKLSLLMASRDISNYFCKVLL